MLITVSRSDIIDCLQKSSGIIPAKTGAAFLRTIWLKADDGQLKIMATDSNLEYQGSAMAEVKRPGLVGAPGKSFYELVKKLPDGDLTLEADMDGRGLKISQGSRKYRLPAGDPSWFEPFKPFPEDGAVFWSGDYLQEIIDKVAFCISDEDAMEAIACMSLRPAPSAETDAEGNSSASVEACGLNGHQFAMFTFVNPDLKALLPKEGALIQKRFLLELKKWLTADDIELNIADKRLFVRTADKREIFSLPLSFYQYPDYHAFLNRLSAEGGASMLVDRQELFGSLERINIFNTDANRCVYFDMGAAGEVTLRAQGQEVGEASESLATTTTGDLKRIAFPTRNLLDILSHFSSGDVTMAMTSSEGPCGVTGPEDANYVVILMPMKIVEETYYVEDER